ncbi:hypothetical protein AB0958_18540 [Streptomyces sp. NPDC006655]|uniref:hypothetical protein n=1 Tax=Streptomyces sp. NPDC006655 TaxID=3156898 RepID=UPI003454287C
MTAPARQRRLVPVACRTRHGDPDGVHLAVEEWIPRAEQWVTGPALCGQTAEQGALPADTVVTCTDGDGSCESYRDSYQRALDGRPTAQQEETDRLRAELEAERAAAALVTEYRIPCPGHRLGAGADIIVQRMPTADRWAIFNPNLDSPLRAWTGERYERIGTDIYRREGFRWTRREALDLAPGLAEQETARDWAWFEEMRAQAGRIAQ